MKVLIALFVIVLIGYLLKLLIEDAARYRTTDRDFGYSLPEWTFWAALKRIFTGKRP
jgi:hypothetical protein